MVFLFAFLGQLWVHTHSSDAYWIAIFIKSEFPVVAPTAKVFNLNPLHHSSSFHHYCSNKMSKRLFPNDSNAPCNNSPPRKKQRMHCITTSNEEFKFPSGNNEYNEQEIKFILNAMKIHTYGQRKVIAALLFYSFLTAGFTPEQACSCIKLLFQKTL